MRPLLAAALILSAAAPAFADNTQGKVLAYDRVAKLLVLEDKTVWSLETLAEAPADLAAGREVTIEFHSNADNGYDKINKVTVEN
ncbi:hypothetical protein [Litorisediminicola beolgyonensis]|uniref:DUF1344 domain-containing protein n=1 Tax=Litorisediminicola beolgyonensis TaxID=1173614 RepID=A0ABW3ZMH7_9RHOB